MQSPDSIDEGMKELVLPGMKENKVIQLTEREHVLLRPSRYLGSIEHVTHQRFIIGSEGKFVYLPITYVPALVKMVREIIDNSVDEAIRTGYKYANKIDITINEEGRVIIVDNGRGIPVKETMVKREVLDSKTGKITIQEEPRLQPDLAWTSLRAGSNFLDEDDNKTIGQNGEGASLVAIFSKEFVGETSDGKMKCTVACSGNLEHKTVTTKKCSKNYTQVMFFPDYQRINLEGFTEIHYQLLKTDLACLSIMHPKIVFTLNGNKLENKNFKKFMEDGFPGLAVEVMEESNLKVAVLSNNSDDFNFLHFINGINVYEGGNPMNWVVTQILNPLKEISEKRLKLENIRIGDIKNKITIVALFQNMNNPRFENQVKSKCSTQYSDFKTSVGAPDWDKFASRLVKNMGIMSPVINTYKIQEELRELDELADMSKTKKKIRVAKYVEPTRTHKYFVLAEGDSAASGIMKVLGREEFGYFPLRGKPLNIFKADVTKISNNEEIKNIINILGIDLSRRNQDKICYENILFATDADCLSEDTIIRTQTGDKALKDIQFGEMVLTHTFQYQRVINIIEKMAEELINITINETIITCTPDHKFIINRNGISQKIRAEDIKLDDLFLLKNQEPHDSENEFIMVQPKEITRIVSHQKVIDITVENDHTFFIVGKNTELILSKNCDGIHIRSLLISLFSKYCPRLFIEKRIKFLQTPLVVLKNTKTNKMIKYFFTLNEFMEYQKTNPLGKTVSYQYYKGLGTWEQEDLENLIKSEGLDTFIKTYDHDEGAETSIREWMKDGLDETGGTLSDVRKTFIRGKEFEISSI